MTAITQTQSIQSFTGQRRIVLALILGMLMLRFMVTGFRLVFSEPPGWVLPCFEIGTYILVAILLLLESGSLEDYHINPLAIWMIILGKPIETIYLATIAKQSAPMTFPMVFPGVPSLLVWAVALTLLVYFRSRLFQWRTVHWKNLMWVLLGGLAGFVVVLATSYPLSFEVPPLDPTRWTVSTVLLTNSPSFLYILYQLGYAAISEEPVFRGFLWGFLRKSGWRDVWIWLFQAGLFFLAHLYYFRTDPILFWLLVPVGGLVLGWLVWRSRSIATSMVAHGVMNGFSWTFAYLVAVIRL